MGKNKNATKPLTHAEIWDDSALVRSWDEAVEEYKLYHSIQARGETVEDVLKEAEEAELAGHQDQSGDVNVAPEEGGGDIDDGEEGGEEEDYDMQADDAGVGASEVNPSQDIEQTPRPSQEWQKPGADRKEAAGRAEPSTTGPAAPMPQAVLAQGQDEGLKNLMMSWYYAGYYTGLYEGQQRGKQNASNGNHNAAGS